MIDRLSKQTGRDLSADSLFRLFRSYFKGLKVHCPSCLEKHHRKGKVTYSHQMLGASLVHPHLKVIAIKDGLSSNAPPVDDLRDGNARYILGVKRGDHTFLFQLLEANDEAGRTGTLTLIDEATEVLHHFRFHKNMPLNESHQDHLVNVLEYWEVQPNKFVENVRRKGLVQHFSGITDWELTPDSVYPIMRGRRAKDKGQM